MENTQNYIVDSLEQHLFFARIMKEHALFLKVGFLPPGAGLAQEGERFLRQFEGVLSRAITLSDHVARECVLHSGEVFTQFTDCAERQTQRLTGTMIDRGLTARAMHLTGRDCDDKLCVPRGLTAQVRQLNRHALMLVERFINYKERILRCVNSCGLFTANYPLLIEHLLREARLYRAHLRRLEGQEDCSCQEHRDDEPFWDQIMMEHALFMRGMLDPGEEELIKTAGDFAEDYRRLLDASEAAGNRMMQSGDALGLTQKFRHFKQDGVAGIEACKIRSIILPLLADHVLREANHYIRLLES